MVLFLLGLIFSPNPWPYHLILPFPFVSDFHGNRKSIFDLFEHSILNRLMVPKSTYPKPERYILTHVPQQDKQSM